MGILASILSQWRFGLYGLAAAALLIFGWTANGWRMDAAKLNDAKAALRTTQERMAQAQRAAIKADEERATMGLKLTEAEAALLSTSTQAKVVIRRVVKTDPRCDIDAAVVRVMRNARSGNPEVPATPKPATRPSGAIIAAP